MCFMVYDKSTNAEDLTRDIVCVPCFLPRTVDAAAILDDKGRYIGRYYDICRGT